MPLPASLSSVYPVEGGGFERAHTGNLRRPETNIHPSQASSPDSLLWTQETHRASPKVWGKEVLRPYRCPEITSILSSCGGVLSSQLWTSPRAQVSGILLQSLNILDVLPYCSIPAGCLQDGLAEAACCVLFVLWCQECTYYMSLEGPHSGGTWFPLYPSNLVPSLLP